MNITKLPETLTKEKIEALRKAFGYFYEEGKSKNFRDPETGTQFENVTDFVDYLYSPAIGIPDKTSAKHIGIILESWYETFQKGAETTTEIPKYEEASTSSPSDAGIRAIREEERRIRAEGKQSADINAEQKASEFIEKEKKRAEDRKIYAKVKIDKPELPEEQQKAAEVIVEEIKKAPTPQEAIKIVEPIIRAQVPEEIPDAAVELTAATIVINARTNFTPQIQTATVETVTQKPEYTDFTSILSDQSKSLSELRELTTGVTKIAFGEEGEKIFFPEVLVEDVSEVPMAGYVSIQAPPIYTTNTTTEEVEVVTFGRTWVQEQLSQIGEGNIQGSDYNPKKLQSSFSEFRPLTGLAKDAAMKQVKKLATKAISKTATGVAVKTGLQTLATSVGLAGGPLGSLAAWIGIEVLSKLGSKIKQFLAEHKQDVAIAGLLLIGGGALMGSIPLMVLGGFIAIPSLIGGATLAGIGGGIIGIFGALGGATLGAIGGPILFILLGFPVIVAFILFIINSGAYVVPPSISSLNSQNQYIDVTKTANPPGPFQNSNLPLKITYTITVTAKKETLTHVTIKDTCSAITKSGSSDCGNQTVDIPGGVIQVGSPFTFTYDSSYDSRYKDSLAVNTVTVTAKVVSESNPQTAIGEAALIIGNPPTGCFKLDGSWKNPGMIATMTKAIAKLTQATTYAARLCQKGTITVKYLGPSTWGGWTIDANTIGIYNLGVNLGDNATLYTLAHESGHILAARTSLYSDDYLNRVDLKNERPICSYPVQPHPASEDFAEMIGLYVAKAADTRNGAVCGMFGNGFRTKYPKHWNYANKTLFGGQMLDW